MKGKIVSDLELIYLCAFRYALGRKTYIVSVVADWLKNHSDELSNTAKNLIIKEIENPLFGLGHNCDEGKWRELKVYLKNKLESELKNNLNSEEKNND